MNDMLSNIRNQVYALAQQIQQNPVAFLRQAGYNLPQNLTDPNSIVQHLMNSGQVTQQKYDWARQTANALRNR